MSDDKNQDLEQNETNTAPDEQETQSSDIGQLPSGFKITKGMLIIGLIVFVVVLFGIQKYIHFEGSESDRSRAKDEMKDESHGSNMVVANDASQENPPAVNQAPAVPAQQNAPSMPSQGGTSMPSSIVPSASNGAGVISPNDQKNIQDIVRQYIVNNPEIVAEALQNLNAKAEQAKESQSKNFLANNMNSIIANRPYFGNASGNIVIIDFFDYKCSYCKTSNAVLERIVKDYPEVKVVLEPLPVLGKSSSDAARASLAVWRISPKNFMQFHDALINSPTIDQPTMMSLASKQGISTDALTKEMNSPDVQNLMNSNMTASQQIGVKGVPTFIVNGELIPGSLTYEGFKDLLDKARMRKK